MILLYAEDFGDTNNATSSAAAACMKVVDHHLALSRVLVLHGAFPEAAGHLHSAEEIVLIVRTQDAGERCEVLSGEWNPGQNRSSSSYNTNNSSCSCSSSSIGGKQFEQLKGVAIAALRLEITLLSHAPVVLSSKEEASGLKVRLVAELIRSGVAGANVRDGIHMPNPLEVGVRGLFLLTYQVPGRM